MHTPPSPTQQITGLENVIATATRLSKVDGQMGQLLIGGFPVEELAGTLHYEETLYLLWYERLPSPTELCDFQAALARYRQVPEMALTLLREAAGRAVDPMDALMMASGTLGLDAALDTPEEKAMLAVARFPGFVAAYHRFCAGLEAVEARTDLSHAANYLYMLTGQLPSDAQVRALESYLNTVVDHGLNASTFTARVIVSTRSDMVSAITGALGALKGPLHGGAPGPALDMVHEIGHVSRAKAYLRDKLAKGERLMGFGHRVYKVRDPRAEVLAAAASQFYGAGGNPELFALAKAVEDIAVRLLEEHKPGRNLQTNVEYYTALLLHGLGFETNLFTPTFAVGRVGGWAAHCFEQIAADKLIRPKAAYIGPVHAHLVR